MRIMSSENNRVHCIHNLMAYWGLALN